MSPSVRSPADRLAVVAVIAIVFGSVLLEPQRASAAGRTGPVGAVGDSRPRPTEELATCDPESGPRLWPRFVQAAQVNLFGGYLVMTATDVGESAPMADTFTRSYSGIDDRTTFLGKGWTSNFAVRLRGDGQGNVLFTQADGAVEEFKNALSIDRTTGTNRPLRTLTRSSTGMVVIDGASTWTFDSTGSLTRFDDGSGDWMEIRYENGKLLDTKGPDGPGLRFEFAPSDRLSRVVDMADPTRFVDYEYDAAWRLRRAAPSGSPAQRYVYDGGSQRITTISDDAGAVLQAIEYDGKGRVVREQDAQGLLDGTSATVVYEEQSDGGIRATLTWPASLIERGWRPTKTVTHDGNGFVREIRGKPTSSQTFVGRFDYDQNNNQLVVEDPCATVQPAPPPAGPVDGLSGLLFSLVQAVLRALGG
jgi:hypothetical protein